MRRCGGPSSPSRRRCVLCCRRAEFCRPLPTSSLFAASPTRSRCAATGTRGIAYARRTVLGISAASCAAAPARRFGRVIALHAAPEPTGSGGGGEPTLLDRDRHSRSPWRTFFARGHLQGGTGRRTGRRELVDRHSNTWGTPTPRSAAPGRAGCATGPVAGAAEESAAGRVTGWSFGGGRVLPRETSPGSRQVKVHDLTNRSAGHDGWVLLGTQWATLEAACAATGFSYRR